MLRAIRCGLAPAAVLLLLSGCASGPATPPQLALEPPERFAGLPPVTEALPEAVKETTAVSPEAEWWREFGNDQLDEVVTAALRNNPSLRLAAANLDGALAQGRIEGANLLPQASLGLNGAKRKQNFIGFPIPGAEGRVLSTTSTNTGLSLNVSWETDLWGRLRAQKAAVYADAAATAEDLAAARLSIAGQAVKAWLALTEAEEQVHLAERTLSSRQRTEERIHERYRRGLSQPLDVRLTRTQTASVESQLAQQRLAADTARRQLEALAGRYPSGALRIAGGLPELPPRAPTGVPADVVSRRPDLRAAERRAFAASARLRAARASLYPTLSLSGSTGTSAGSALGDLLDGDFSVWSLAANLLQPLFQGGRLRAGATLAEAGLDAAEATWLQTALTAFVEAESALAAEELLARRVEALEVSVIESQAAERLALGRYNRGLADFLGVLDSQRTTFQSESQLLAARREQLTARVDLVLALGGSAPDAATAISPTSSSP